MKIRWRLILTYLVGLLLPLILVLVINPENEMTANEPEAIPLWVIGAYDYQSPEEKKDLEIFYTNVERQINNNPALISDTNFRLSIREKLYDKAIYLAIDDKTKKLISPSEEQKYWYFNADLAFGNYKEYFFTLFIKLLVAYLIIYGLFTHLMSRSITRPLGKLKASALHLSEGDYSYRISEYSKDELGEVSQVFDQMAQKIENLIQQRNQYDESRRALLANISHDLKTPLAAMKMTTEALQDGLADTPEKRERYMQVIDDKVEQMQQLIETVLLFSKLDFKQEPFYFQKVSVASFVEDIIEEWQFLYATEDVRIHLEYDPQANWNADIDLEKMRRVFLNLLDNSKKYAGVTPLLIKIELTATPTHIIFSVSDNGSGVKKSEVHKLTEQFYKADASRSTQALSHGLGLSISEQIIKGHQGALTLDSDIHDGFTATFTALRHAPTDKTASSQI